MPTESNSVKSVCPYCGVGCGMILQVENGRITKVSGNKEHPANFGRLCTKGSTCGGILESSGRLGFGSVRETRDGKYIQKPIDTVLATAAERFRSIIDKHGPDSVAFYVSGQMSLESQYLANKLCKGFIGTNNIDSNSRLCMSSAASGYKLSLGADGPPGSYKDIDQSDCFLVIGANMADCHPILYLRMMDRVKSAGAKLIVVDPRKTSTAEKADLFLPIKPGTDLAFLNGLLHLLVESGKIDRAFIAKHTSEWEQLEPFLKEYTPAKVADWTGIPEADLRKAAEWIGASPQFITFWTMGLNQSTHGTWHTNAICNLHLAMGKICRPGSGPFSLTGQPNAMGGREVGYLSHGLPGQRTVTKAEDRAFVEKVWGTKPGSIRAEPGHDAINLFKKMETGEVKAVWIICTNPVASMPNRQRVIDGLQKAELVIVQDAYHPTETTKYADILLPGALWAEADGTMVNSERNVTLMRKAIDPPGEALPDWEIIARIARKMGYANAFQYTSASEVFDEIRQTYNPQTGYDLRGMSYAKLRQHPMQWPCGPDGSDSNPIRYIDAALPNANYEGCLTFPTEDGRGHFLARPFMPPDELPDEKFPFILITGRMPHQWHTMTKTGKIPTLNKLNSGPFVELHPDDANVLNIADGDTVAVSSRRGVGHYPATITTNIRPGACFVPFHWNDLFGENLAINAATSDAVDPESHQPELKFCAVSLQRIAAKPSVVTEPSGVASDAATTRHSNISRGIRDARALVPSHFQGQKKLYLEGMLCAITSELEQAKNLRGIPTIPASAPFESEERTWLDGYLAGLFSRTYDFGASSQQSAPRELPDVPTITILFGSQTGNAEALAYKLAQSIPSRGAAIPVYALSEYTKVKWNRTQTVLIVTSTYGDGDPPDNARAFWNFMNGASAPKLSGITYAVLALGDKNYDQFCRFGRTLDERLEALGAQRLCTRADCDADYESTADAWFAQIQSTLEATASEISQSGHSESLPDGLDILPSNNREPLTAVTTAPAYSKTKPFSAQVLENRILTGAKSEKEVRHISFSLLDSGISYQVGDALGIWPANCPELVDELLSLLKLKGSESCTGADGKAITLRDALLTQFEISKPSHELLQTIATRCGGMLASLTAPEKSAELKKYLWGRQIADLLHEHSSAIFAPQEFVGLLKKLQPRLYSISSSPNANPGEVHITASVVRYSTAGRRRKGVCSTFLAERTNSGKAPLFIQPSHGFKLPTDGSTPILMVGPGTGVAPFRAFLQERRASQAKGRNWLFFGDQRQDENFLYREELEAMRNDGLLTRLDTAFSRDQSKKVYVQNRMLENGAEIWRWLQDGAHFYICGDASRMAKDVDTALRAIIQQHGALTEERAAAYVEKLVADKRYQRDVY